MNELHGLSSLWPGFNSWPGRSVSRDCSVADHTCCLVHSLRRLKARPTVETVVESRVAPLCEKLLPISNDGPNKRSPGKMSTNQDELWWPEKIYFWLYSEAPCLCGSWLLLLGNTERKRIQKSAGKNLCWIPFLSTTQLTLTVCTITTKLQLLSSVNCKMFQWSMNRLEGP